VSLKSDERRFHLIVDRTDLRSKTRLPTQAVNATSTGAIDIVHDMFHIALELIAIKLG
jgi:hypothetical protein